jgi:hypothetical protein
MTRETGREGHPSYSDQSLVLEVRVITATPKATFQTFHTLLNPPACQPISLIFVNALLPQHVRLYFMSFPLTHKQKNIPLSAGTAPSSSQ